MDKHIVGQAELMGRYRRDPGRDTITVRALLRPMPAGGLSLPGCSVLSRLGQVDTRD